MVFSGPSPRRRMWLARRTELASKYVPALITTVPPPAAATRSMAFWMARLSVPMTSASAGPTVTVIPCPWPRAAEEPASVKSRKSAGTRTRSCTSNLWNFVLLRGHGVLFDVLLDPRVQIRAGSARRDVVERFGVLDAVLPAQFAVASQQEFLNVIAVGGGVVVAQQGQATDGASPIPPADVIRGGRLALSPR